MHMDYVFGQVNSTESSMSD